MIDDFIEPFKKEHNLPDPDPFILAGFLIPIITDCVNRLKPMQKVTYKTAYEKCDMSAKQLAVELTPIRTAFNGKGATENFVKSNLNKARESIKRGLNDEFSSDVMKIWKKSSKK